MYITGRKAILFILIIIISQICHANMDFWLLKKKISNLEDFAKETKKYRLIESRKLENYIRKIKQYNETSQNILQDNYLEKCEFFMEKIKFKISILDEEKKVINEDLNKLSYLLAANKNYLSEINKMEEFSKKYVSVKDLVNEYEYTKAKEKIHSILEELRLVLGNK